jgi:hypothetical protein
MSYTERYKQTEEETPWFHGRVKPSYIGVYRRVGLWLHQFGSENLLADGYAYWDGTCWSVSARSLERVERCRKSDLQPRPGMGELFMWCGLKKMPPTFGKEQE